MHDEATPGLRSTPELSSGTQATGNESAAFRMPRYCAPTTRLADAGEAAPKTAITQQTSRRPS
ncbi:hypothetical protein HDG40_006005 [Paraburkholderia sp. JPY158]|uniref:Uncharacterized protein n=1 Tax=Paraburkholderia atlantica TaxID=2654982 RepID=A0A7W8QCC6_PARAM|nr:hypothetical protein [Paraburkholderia atlantica]